MNEDAEIKRLTGNAEALAKMAGINLRLVHEAGYHRAYIDDEELYSVRSPDALPYLKMICQEIDRAILDHIGQELKK
jgi:hypothetical protein